MIGEEQVLSVKGFKSGLVTRVPATLIPDDAFADCQNIELDDKYVPTKSTGHQKYNTSGLPSAPIRGGIVYTLASGVKYYVVACGGKLWYSIAGSGTFTAYQIGGVDLTINNDVDVEIVQYQDCLWIVNGLYPVISNAGYETCKLLKISATTPSIISSVNIPQGGKYIIVHQERLFIAGSTDELNGLYWSMPYEPENWTPEYGLNYDYVGKDDGEIITGIKEYQGYVFVGKPHNIYRYATQGDITSWQSQRVDTHYGWLYNRTIQEFFGYLVYLSGDGVIQFDGSSATIISEQIRDKILALPQLTSNIRQWLQTTTSDFSLGTYGDKVIDISDDEIKLKAQETQADWDAGTKVNVDTSTFPNSVVITPVDVALNKTISIIGMDIVGGTIEAMVDGDDTTFAILRDHDIQVMYINIDIVTSKIINGIRILGGAPSTSFQLQYSNNNIDWNIFPEDEYFTSINDPTVFVSKSYASTGSHRYYRLLIHSDTSISQYFYIYTISLYTSETSYSLITQAIDWVNPYTTYFNLVADYTLPSGTNILFQSRSGSNTVELFGSPWNDIYPNGNNGGRINEGINLGKRYLQIKAIFITPDGYTSPILNKIYIGAPFRSAIKDIGFIPSAWGDFRSSYSLNTAFADMYMRSADTYAGIDTATWYLQTPNSKVVNVPLKRFIQFEIRLNTYAPSRQPSVQSVQIDYYSGTKTTQPCSAVWKNNYWLNITDVGSSTNDIVYQYNKNGYWLKRTNKKNNVYFSDELTLLSGTSESDGFVRINDSGNKDDDTDIVSFFTTRCFEIAQMTKLFRRLYVNYRAGTVFKLSYSINGGAYSDIVLSAQSIFTTLKRTFSGIVSGKFIQFKITNGLEDSIFEFGGFDLNWQGLRQYNIETDNVPQAEYWGYDTDYWGQEDFIESPYYGGS